MNPVDQLVGATDDLNVAPATAAALPECLQVLATYGVEVPGKSTRCKLEKAVLYK